MNNRNWCLRNYAGVVLALLGLLAGQAQTVEANGCGPILETPAPTVTERTLAAPIVIEGLVTAVSGSEADSVASVQVYQYLKGSGPALVHISGFHASWTLYDCPDWVGVGDYLIFFANARPDSDKLYTFVVGGRGSTTPATAENLAETIASAGQRPVTPYPQSEAPSTPEANTSPNDADGSQPATPASTPARPASDSTLVIIFLLIGGGSAIAAIILVAQRLYTERKRRS